jgi:vacuolar-type H+-ATPase subunit E/Vma4
MQKVDTLAAEMKEMKAEMRANQEEMKAEMRANQETMMEQLRDMAMQKADPLLY